MIKKTCVIETEVIGIYGEQNSNLLVRKILRVCSFCSVKVRRKSRESFLWHVSSF